MVASKQPSTPAKTIQFAAGTRTEGTHRLLESTRRMKRNVSLPSFLSLGLDPQPYKHFGGEVGSNPDNAPTFPSSWTGSAYLIDFRSNNIDNSRQKVMIMRNSP